MRDHRGYCLHHLCVGMLVAEAKDSVTHSRNASVQAYAHRKQLDEEWQDLKSKSKEMLSVNVAELYKLSEADQEAFASEFFAVVQTSLNRMPELIIEKFKADCALEQCLKAWRVALFTRLLYVKRFNANLANTKLSGEDASELGTS